MLNFIKRLQNKSTPRHGQTAPFAVQSVFDAAELGNWYHPVMLSPGSLGALATDPASLRQGVQIIESLVPDDYIRYLLAYYRLGLKRFGDAWRYADIITALLSAARLVRPRRYLEIGVRRGRSMAMVAATCPDCELVGFDMWIADYAGMPSPGPDAVRAAMHKLGHVGSLELITGNSHVTIPQYLSRHPQSFFDLVTVDGDHSRKGAEQDLRDILPRLMVGGVLVFDDICHPSHPYLMDVWRRIIVADRRFATWEFTELGYGVALAVRKDN